MKVWVLELRPNKGGLRSLLAYDHKPTLNEVRQAVMKRYRNTDVTNIHAKAYERRVHRTPKEKKIMVPVHKLVPGSTWQKTRSEKFYRVIEVGIDAKTNRPVVLYRKLVKSDNGNMVPTGYICSRPLEDFLSTEVTSEDATGRTYAFKFVPAEGLVG